MIEFSWPIAIACFVIGAVVVYVVTVRRNRRRPVR